MCLCKYPFLFELLKLKCSCRFLYSNFLRLAALVFVALVVFALGNYWVWSTVLKVLFYVGLFFMLNLLLDYDGWSVVLNILPSPGSSVIEICYESYSRFKIESKGLCVCRGRFLKKTCKGFMYTKPIYS